MEQIAGDSVTMSNSSGTPCSGNAILACHGEYWTVGYSGKTFSLKDSKGLQHIHHLLHHPSKEFHALDLISDAGATTSDEPGVLRGTPPTDGSLRIGPVGDSGEMLDAQAKGEYKRRLHELREELAELRERGAEERAAEVEIEIDFIVREISRAVGLGGRDRRAGSAAERARLNVTRAIKSAIEKIAEREALLADVLTKSIKTGTFCSFVPYGEVPVVWQFSLETAHPTRASTQHDETNEFQLRSSGTRWVLESNRFVGREAENSALRRNLEAALQHRGRIVTIGGEPGVGKSRLSRELCEYASKSGFLTLAGSCSDSDGAVPFLPFVEILESALSQSVSAEAFIRALGPNAGEVARLIPQLRTMFPDIPQPMETTPEQSRRMLFNSVVDLLARVAGRDPMLLLIEDLHWADEGSLSLLEHLARSTPSLPVMIVVNYRDSNSDLSDALTASLYRLSRMAHAEHIKLSGLREPDVGEMIEALEDKSPPAGIVGPIYAATDGNPLFVREIYQHLLELGQLFDASGDFLTELNLDEIEIPRQLKLLIGKRLSLLGLETRMVLARAAVIGRSFSFDLLQAGSDSPPDRLLDDLEQAERDGVITSALENREARFYFSHELIRQSVLGELSAPRRQQFHLATANAIEKMFAETLDNHSIDLANHLLQAGTLADPRRTIKYLALSARRAKMQSAYQSAFGHLKHALSLVAALPPGRDRSLLELELLLDFGVTAFTTKGWWVPEVGTAYNRARALCEELGDKSSLFFVFFGLWSFHLVRADHATAYGFAMEMQRLASEARDASNLTIAGWAVGASQFFMGKLAEAHATFDETIRNYDRERDRGLVIKFAQDPSVCCLCFDAMALWMMGDAEHAERRAKQCLELARAVGDRFVLVWCLTMLTKYKVMRRDFDDIDQWITEGLTIAKENGYEYYRTSLHAYRLAMDLELGKYEQLSKSSSMYAKHNYLAKPWVYSVIAEAMGNCGKADDGLALINQALEALELTSERYAETELYRIRGGLRLKTSDSAGGSTGSQTRMAAEQDFRTAIEIARRRGAKMLELRAAVDLARLMVESGRREEATALLGGMSAEFPKSLVVPDLERAKGALLSFGSASLAENAKPA